MIMKLFVRNHAVLLILVVTTAIDASRLFYLPLPKIHPSHHAIPPTDNSEPKSSNHDDYPPSPSALEREKPESNTFESVCFSC